MNDKVDVSYKYLDAKKEFSGTVMARCDIWSARKSR
jgi:hypothetical protein